MLKWLGLILICLSLKVLAQANSPYCEVLDRLKLGMGKIDAINAVGEPYNHTFEMKPEGTMTHYRFDLDKAEFIELYLVFGKEGKLATKNIAGTICAE